MPALDSHTGKIGPYRLLDKIGEGGMGMVYLASDAENRPVAVKVLGLAVATDPNARRRLFREVETMRRVRSPYVAEVLDADVDGPSPYIVTRYVPGRTLDDIVRKDGPLRGAALEQLATGLASALAAIHAAAVVHRDLKPGNVMIVDGHPVVIDFGIAHIPDATRLTQTGMVMGTPGYLAPEVIEGQPSTPAVDVHSWGATVAFAATGHQPYGSGTYQTIFFRVLQGQADLGGIPAPLMPLVTAALAVDPRLRPPAQWLAERCSLMRLDPASTPGHGPSGTRVAPVAVPWWHEHLTNDWWQDHLNRASAQPNGYGYPQLDGFGNPQPNGSGYPQPNGFSAAPPGWPAAAPAAPAAPLPRPVYKSPAEAAQEVAGLLPPVQPGAPYRPVNGHRSAAASPPVAGQGLVMLAFGVAAVALAVLMPVAGTVLVLAVITLLRAADRAQARLAARRSMRGARPSDIVIVIVSAPWTVARALLTMLALSPLALIVAGAAAAASVVFGKTQTLPWAGAWAAGAAVAMYAVGPGSGAPRRQLRRMTSSVIRSRASLLVALIAAWALAAAVISSALSQPPVIWPATSWMLPHVLPSMGGTLHTVQEWLLRNTVGMLHLP